MCGFALRRAAARQAEVSVEIDFAACPAEARRHDAQQGGEIEEMVVPREIADRDEIQSCVGLHLPVAAAQCHAYRRQFGSSRLAAPIGLLRVLEFAPRADAWEAEIVCECHRALLVR